MQFEARQPPYLEHYGTKGQKWGIRRFQNEDGSYTAEGKERYGRGGDGKAGGIFKSKGKNKRDWKPKDAESLSDDELNKRNSRLQREEQYRNATTPKWKKEVQQTSKDWVKEAAKKIFVAGAVALAATAMRKHYADAFNYIGKKANVKVASMRAAHILKKEVSRRNYFDNRGPDILGKHTGRR